MNNQQFELAYSPQGYLIVVKTAEKGAFAGKRMVCHMFFKGGNELRALMEWLHQNGFEVWQPPEQAQADFGMPERVSGSTPICPEHKQEMLISKKYDGWYCGHKVGRSFCDYEARKGADGTIKYSRKSAA